MGLRESVGVCAGMGAWSYWVSGWVCGQMCVSVALVVWVRLQLCQ